MLIPEVIERFVLQALEGKLSAPILRVPPVDKNAFPKVLVVDMLHWVGLAKAHYGRSTDSTAVDALAALERAINTERLIVPLHFMNAVEAARRADPKSRARAVDFMVRTTRNHCIRPAPVISLAEKHSAIESVYLGKAPTFPVRPLLLELGLVGMMGPTKLPPEVQRALSELGVEGALNALLISPDATASFITERMSELARQDDAREKAATEKMRATRAVDRSLTEKARMRLELENLWLARSGEGVRSMLRRLEVDITTFKEWLTDGENVFRFWSAVPSVYVPLQLEVTSTKQAQRAFQQNDLRDMELYETALPYANIVLTEAYWSERIQHSKLDAQHGTRVIRSLGELPKALEAEGVL